MRKLLVFLVLSCYGLLIGCAAIVVGAGAGASTYSYIKGELKRTYQTEVDLTIAAGKEVLVDLQMTILESKSDGIQTVVRAERADKTPVVISFTMLAPRMTEVGVRCGVVGIWNKKISKLIHDLIAQRLQQ